MTEIASINNGLNAAGVRAPLYWFHDKGFFEEFLGDKKGERIGTLGPIRTDFVVHESLI